MKLSNLIPDFSPLRESRDYRLLFIGQLISFFGTMMTFIVVPVQMYQMTESNLQVGLLGVAEFVPMFFLAFIGGSLADAVDRRMMLRLTEVGQMITVIILLINASLETPQVWVLYVAVGIHAGFAGLQRPSFEALIPKLVAPEKLPAVAVLNTLRAEFGFILAPVIGGFVIATYGAAPAYLIDLLSFSASLTAVWLIRPAAKPKNADKPGLQSMIGGFKYAMSRQELLGTYIVDFVAMFFGMPKALFPAIAFGLGAGATVGTYYAAMAVGALVASVTGGWTGLVDRHGLMVFIGAGGWGIAIILFGFSDSLYLGLVFLAVAGFFDMISGFFRQTIWNQTVPDRYRGRLAGMEMISFLAGPMLADAESGIVAYFTDVKTSVISGGALALFGVIILAFLMPGFLSYRGSEGMKIKAAEDAENERNRE